MLSAGHHPPVRVPPAAQEPTAGPRSPVPAALLFPLDPAAWRICTHMHAHARTHTHANTPVSAAQEDAFYSDDEDDSQ